MSYNLKPILRCFTDDNAEEKVERFFSDDPSPEKDEYYDILLSDLDSIKILDYNGYIYDRHSGLISYDDPVMLGKHSFVMAKYVRDNFTAFINKKMSVITEDMGIVSNQLRMIGCDVNTFMQPILLQGAVLTCILNDCVYIPFNKPNVSSDVIIVCSAFNNDDNAYHLWNSMLDLYSKGKEVYFTCDQINSLKKYYLPDKIEIANLDKSCYSDDELADLRYGYRNKIYRIV
jgi:hypothetical protein